MHSKLSPVQKKLLFALAVVIAVAALTLSSTPYLALYINGEKSESPALYRGNMIFVPLKEVVEKMGDGFEWQSAPIFALVKQEDKEIYVASTMSVAKVNNKDVPYVTEEINGVVVPVQVKPFAEKQQLYVPVDFVRDVLGYPVVIQKDGKATFVFIGTLPEVMPTEKDVVPPEFEEKIKQQEQQLEQAKDIKYDLPYKPPAGWVPPQIKSVATDDFEENAKILEEELGLLYGSSFNPYGKKPGNSQIIIVDGDKNHIAQIYFMSWYGSKTKEDVYNKTPYIAREIFKFYFPTEYNKIFEIMDDGFNGEDVSKYIDNPFALDDREVKIVELENSVCVIISKKGESVE